VNPCQSLWFPVSSLIMAVTSAAVWINVLSYS
jgi:hypothetical protein